MAYLLYMPEVAADSAEAVLQDWVVAENTEFSAAETLATVETEKAVIDVEAESAGLIVRRLVEAGDSVILGDPIALIAEPDERVGDVDALLVSLGARNGATHEQAATQEQGATSEETTAQDEATGQPERAASSPVPTGEGEERAETRAKTQSRLFISPLARTLARDAGLDADHVTGTGPKGRIRKRDVEAAIAGRAEPQGGQAGRDQPEGDQPKGSAGQPSQGSGTQPEGVPNGYTEVPHTRIRRAVASRLLLSKQTVPHFYVKGTADVEALMALREGINATGPVRVSLNDLLVKAAGVALSLHPEMNVTWTEEAVRAYESVSLSVAIASERGLVAPVLRNVDTMRITEISAAVRDLAERANAGTLTQAELEGGAFSLSNLGMLGTEEFTAIINPPQAAILAVGAIREEPVVRQGRVEVSQVIHFVLSVDHRPVDGVVAAKWMRTFLGILESPLRILL